jgi:hypothetical protein
MYVTENLHSLLDNYIGAECKGSGDGLSGISDWASPFRQERFMADLWRPHRRWGQLLMPRDSSIGRNFAHVSASSASGTDPSTTPQPA